MHLEVQVQRASGQVENVLLVWDGCVAISLLSGTLPVTGGEFIYADKYAMTLADPVLGRRIEHDYTVFVLEDRT